ncbi:S-adenosyl-L-methionine-dependent methyltransferase [Zopfochytrium polystomum]|nr:S-adenosyl-L-methionine-dependent methyltransferase [Zopfochytrium polystomum]
MNHPPEATAPAAPSSSAGAADPDVDFFSRQAAEWDSRGGVSNIADGVSAGIESFLREKNASGGLTLVELGCGTGLLTERLLRNGVAAKSFGIDPAAGMVDVFNWKAKRDGREAVMAAHCLDLSNDVNHKDESIPLLQSPLTLAPNPAQDDFAVAQSKIPQADLVCSHLVFHHIKDVNLVAQRVRKLLKPGTGRIIVTDLLEVRRADGDAAASEHSHSHDHKHSDHHHQHHHHRHHHEQQGGTKGLSDTYDFHNADSHKVTEHHHGFSADRIRSCLELAGFVDVVVIPEFHRFEKETDGKSGTFAVFLASGLSRA